MALLEDLGPHLAEFRKALIEEKGFRLDNGTYGSADGETLYGTLRHVKPARVAAALQRNEAEGQPSEYRGLRSLSVGSHRAGSDRSPSRNVRLTRLGRRPFRGHDSHGQDGRRRSPPLLSRRAQPSAWRSGALPRHLSSLRVSEGG
jgi:hypothetical protein